MILYILRILLATLFLSTGFDKLMKKEEHFVILKEYRIIPEKLNRLLGTIEIYIEVITGIMLLIGLFVKTFGLIAIFLLLTYSYAIGLNLYRGRKEISCGCGGIAGNHHLSWKLIFRNSILIIILLCVLIFQSSLGTIDFLFKGYSFEDVFPFKVYIVTFLWWGLLCFLILMKSYRVAGGKINKLMTGDKI